MTFLHGENDRITSAQVRSVMARAMPRGDYQVQIIPGATEQGAALLRAGLGTEKQVLARVENLLSQNEREWTARNYDGTTFVWSFPGQNQTTAKTPNGRGLGFAPLNQFGLNLR